MGVAGPGGHKICLLREGKLRRPSHPKTAALHSFRDYYRGDEPQAGNGTRILSKTTGPASPLKPARAWSGRSTQPSPSTRPNSPTRLYSSTRPQRPAQGGRTRHTKTSPTSQLHPWRVPQPSHGSAPVPSRPYDGTRPKPPMTKTTVFPPMPMVSPRVATVPLTYPLTRAGVATVPPSSLLTTAGGDLTERHCT